LSAYTHLDQFKRQARMSTWVTTIVINSARMKLRRRPRKVHVALSDQSQDHDSEQVLEMLRDRRPNPEELSQRNELAERAVRFTILISPALRRTFQLRDVYGLSIRDTAKILGVPNGTVKAQTARARAKLKLLMQNSVGRKRKNLGFLSKAATRDPCRRMLFQSDTSCFCPTDKIACATRNDEWSRENQCTKLRSLEVHDDWL